MDDQANHGYLILADISGYTSFVAATELAHAQEILTELLELLVTRFSALLTISKLEGDAVFAYAPAQKFARGETLLELVEATYAAFRDRMEAVRRLTTCECNACRAIPSLDLKFIAHYGAYMAQRVSGIHELVGSDVNLVHRLLKNRVSEATGWRAYALFTEAALAQMGVRPAAVHTRSESYEHLGEIVTHSLDLHARYAQLIDDRRVMVHPEEAYIAFSQTYPVPPPVVWEWLNDPLKRVQYTFEPGLKFVSDPRPGGRTEAGARNHCVHGKNVAMNETVLDWRPFEYLTVEQDSGPFGIMLMTCRLEALPDGGTRVYVYIKGRMPGPGFLSRPLFMFVYMRMFPMPKMFEKIGLRIAEASAQAGDKGLMRTADAQA